MKTHLISKHMLAFFTVLILIFGTVSASALAAEPTKGKCGKDVSWSLSGGKLTISGNGKMYDYGANTDRTVPWESFCDKITAVEVKSPVSYIGQFSFYECNKLKSVKVADSVTDIGAVAFGSCPWFDSLKKGPVYLGKTLFAYIGEEPSSYTIKQGTVTVCSGAFIGSQTLKKITVPSSVKKIDSEAFFFCQNLSSVSFSKGLETIGLYAFGYCALPSVTLPSTVKTIEGMAFSSCGSLKTVTLNNGLTTIGEGAFSYCETLEKITIPETVKKLEGSSFALCPSLKSITVSSKNKYYSSDASGVLYNKSKTELLKYPVARTSTSYTVASSTKTIGREAFEKANNLKKIVLPANLTEIGDYAFCACEKLSSITAPKKLTYLGEYAFSSTAWYNKLSKGPVYFAKAFYGYKGTAPSGTFTVKDGTTCISPYALAAQKKITKVVLPSTVAEIGTGAFRDCTRLESISIPKKVKEIKNETFSNCQKLSSLTLSAYVVSIGDEALSDTGLKTLKILNPACKISKNVFRNYTGEYNLKMTVYGYNGSTAQKLASAHNLKFAAYKSIDMEKCSVSVPKTAAYTGKAVTVKPTVTYYGAKLTEGKHYTVSYKNNTDSGKAYVIIKGNEKYGFTGTRTFGFKIVK
ncbi:MAG: leucine-rich repeat protein [Acutalibacteraceae bacterium]